MELLLHSHDVGYCCKRKISIDGQETFAVKLAQQQDNFFGLVFPLFVHFSGFRFHQILSLNMAHFLRRWPAAPAMGASGLRSRRKRRPPQRNETNVIPGFPPGNGDRR